jgi:transposase
METMYCIGLDVHKKTIDYCVKDGRGRIYAAGSIRATRLELDMWMKTLPQKRVHAIWRWVALLSSGGF